MKQAKEPKIAYYWAIYKEGVKQGAFPRIGFSEAQACSSYAKNVKQLWNLESFEAVKLIAVGEEHSLYKFAINIFNNISSLLVDVKVDKEGFAIIPVELPQEIQQKEEKLFQAEIDLGTSTYNWD